MNKHGSNKLIAFRQKIASLPQSCHEFVTFSFDNFTIRLQRQTNGMQIYVLIIVYETSKSRKWKVTSFVSNDKGQTC